MKSDFMDLIRPPEKKKVMLKKVKEHKPHPIGRVGYWATHKYKRRSVMSISYFCGWNDLVRLVDKCKNDMHRGLVATLFETGGRASEVLTLRKNQFFDKGGYVLVTGMPILKLRDSLETKRNVPMMKTEALVEPMMEWVNEIKEGKIFPYKYNWLYKTITSISKDWWPHRFRAERASQLAIEKQFSVPELMKWFGWKKEETPTHYVRLSVKDLVKKMSMGIM